MLYSAFLIGLLGSLHCVGMCGPLMLAAHAGSSRPGDLVLYQFGRIMTYALLGLLFGTFGWGVHLFGLQRELALITGILLILIALFQFDPEAIIARLNWFGRLQFWLRKTFGRLLRKDSVTMRFALGVMNGLLPCGMVYLAVLGAVNSPGAGRGMLYMVFFGLGTLPLLIATLYFGQRLGVRYKRNVARAGSFVLLVAGALLIWRGGTYQVPAEFWTFQDIMFPPMCH
ncbi:hypothetical protein CEQ90_11780 [Lewinellaceae bacterium SD302]|nr:hypothetical protein CEQ90_11780 [Lewinellaceae bacterium SD302]